MKAEVEKTFKLTMTEKEVALLYGAVAVCSPVDATNRITCSIGRFGGFSSEHFHKMQSELADVLQLPV